MKTTALLVALLSLFFFSCEENKDFFIYILSRNSESKEGNMVLEYNYTNQPISHIGIALDKVYVYSMDYNKTNKQNSSLIKERYEAFWNSKNPANNKLWRIRTTQEEYQKIQQYIDSLEKQKLFYDLAPDTSDGLYCSELVYLALNRANPSKFKQNKISKKLKGIAKILVGSETISYYPADFFLNYNNSIEQLNPKNY
ncbi:MAG: hypothetical protein Q4B43_03650 [Bacteroidota bacterium]|nr:hypothetical protein [Bacteroidota bacterium]